MSDKLLDWFVDYKYSVPIVALGCLFISALFASTLCWFALGWWLP